MLGNRWLVAALALAACGGGDTDDGGSGTEATDETGSTDGADTTDATDATSGDTGDESSSETDETTGSTEPVVFRVRIDNVGPTYEFPSSGSVDTAEGAPSPAVIGPGESYVTQVLAKPGDALQLASMVVQSNDYFIGFDTDGVPLFDAAGDPISGELVGQLRLWDAGTEADEEPGAGTFQPAGAMGGADAPEDPDPTVRRAETVWSPRPAIESWISVNVQPTLGADGAWRFELTLANQSTPGMLSTSNGPTDLSLSPTVWVTMSPPPRDPEVPTPARLFEESEPLPAWDGFETLVEDGGATALASTLDPISGVSFVITPGPWAVSASPELLYADGAPASAELERLAEDGDATPLFEWLFAHPDADSAGLIDMFGEDYEAGAAPPGEFFEYIIPASPGMRLHLAHMLAPSNDVFLASDPTGIALFDDDGLPIEGDRTDEIEAWNAGTEVDQPYGFGVDQPHLQAAPNTGAPDPMSEIRLADFGGPAVSDYARVTITLDE